MVLCWVTAGLHTAALSQTSALGALGDPISEAMAMDVYPIHHKNLIFNLITDYDLTFAEVRAILDDLLEKGAFKNPEGEDAEAGNFFDLEIEKVRYVVDVNGYEVVVYRRTELS